MNVSGNTTVLNLKELVTDTSTTISITNGTAFDANSLLYYDHTNRTDIRYAPNGWYDYNGVWHPFTYVDFPTTVIIEKEEKMAKAETALYEYTLSVIDRTYSETKLHEKRVKLVIEGYIEFESDASTKSGDVERRVEMKHYKELSAIKNIDDVAIIVHVNKLTTIKEKPTE